jgi:hypothetical protein
VPIVALTHPVALPIAQMRQSLAQALPTWQWRCSDDDTGGPNDRAGFERPQTIMGRSSDGIVIVTVEERQAPLPLEAGAPPHQLHLHVSQPSTDSAEIAKRIAVLVCASLSEQDLGAHCQVAPDGPWYTSEEMQRGAAFCKTAGAAQGSIDSFLLSAGRAQPSAAPAGAGGASPLQSLGLPPGSPAERMALAGVDQSFAQILTKIGGADFAKDMGFAPPPFYAEEHPRIDRLPTMVLALEHPIDFDWSRLHELDRFDPGGDWQAEGRSDGSGTLRGRGCTVDITAHHEAVPRYSIENALARSFWFKGGPAAFARQTASLTIVCDLDTRAAPFEDVRETAKVLTLAIGLLARSRGVIALLNAGVGTLLDVPMVQSQVGHLHKNQIPLMMWTWSAPDSMVENSVSMTTGGLLPFLGYEVEVWNAPGTPDWVGDKLGQILNYLLHGRS